MSYTIPGRLNLGIAAAVIALALGLLWLGARMSPMGIWVLGVVFSFVMLTNYALIHEATHDTFHGRSGANWLAGTVLSWFFPTAFTVLRVTHIVHHCCNRTDHEMFDYYYAGDNRLFKYIQWYGLLLGLWWPLIPTGTALLAAARWVTHTPPFKRARSTAVLFDGFGKRELRLIRLEVVSGIAFSALLFHVLSLSWQVVLIYYACFAVNWSTRQYVTHAFTPRSVREGALNLAVSRPLGWILLNGHWDLVHHQHPHVPWTCLALLGRASPPSVSYWRQYLRLWAGPQPCPEPGPDMLPQSAYRAM